MNDIVNDIGNFIFVEDKPQKCDVIIAVGGSYPQIAEKAAALYKEGFAEKIIASGKYSSKTGEFAGVKDKADIYSGNYKTECEFYCDVMIKNGVKRSDIIREDESGQTRENAEFSAAVARGLGMDVKKAIVVCKRFHSRRCQMFFSSAFPESEILIVPADIERGEFNITKENWYKTNYGIKRVMGELSRCGNQFDNSDIHNWTEAE